MVSGEHAIETKRHFREKAAMARMPEALQEIRKLRQEIEELKKKLGG
jgi:cell division septum initiation protein DivIVA